MTIRIQAIIAMLFIPALFGLQTVSAAGKAADEVSISDAYARAVAPGQPNSAIFMSVTNHGDTPHALVGASGTVAKAIELHNHIMEGGMMRMRRVDKIAIPAGATVTLQPGGLHVMLIGLHKTLAEGDMVHVELQFEDGSAEMLMAPVKAVAPMGKGMNMDHGMQEHKHNM